MSKYCRYCFAVAEDVQNRCSNCGAQDFAPMQLPAFNGQQPVANYQPPAFDYQQPAVNYQTPAFDYQQPVANYQPPAFNYQQPADGYVQPMVGVETPVQPGRRKKFGKWLGIVATCVAVAIVAVIFLLNFGDRSETVVDTTITFAGESFALGQRFDYAMLKERYGDYSTECHLVDNEKGIFLEYVTNWQHGMDAHISFAENPDGSLRVGTIQLGNITENHPDTKRKLPELAGIRLGDSRDDVLAMYPELHTKVHFQDRITGSKWYGYADAEGRLIDAKDFYEAYRNNRLEDEPIYFFRVFFNSDGEVYFVNLILWD